MAQAIGSIIAFIIVFGIPYHISKKEESQKRRDMYNNLNKKSVDETDKRDTQTDISKIKKHRKPLDSK